jgi:hypothetical protein
LTGFGSAPVADVYSHGPALRPRLRQLQSSRIRNGAQRRRAATGNAMLGAMHWTAPQAQSGTWLVTGPVR